MAELAPYNLYDLLRASGSAIGRGAAAAGRGALGVGRHIIENSAPELLMDGSDELPVLPQADVQPPSIARHAEMLDAPMDPTPIDRAGIRASNMRAKVQAPGMATHLDIPPSPRSMGTFVSPQQQAESRSIASRGAFQPSPEWSGAGGGLRSAAQMEQDIRAHDLIDVGHKQRLEEIASDDLARGNPADLAIGARKKTLAMEDLLPEYGGTDAAGNPVPYEPSMSYDAGHGSRIFRQRNAPTGPTQGEMSALERALALKRAGQNPKDMLAVQQDQERQGEVGKLMAARRLYDKDVAGGRRTREEADAAFENAVLEAAKKGALREGDFMALAKLLYPDPESMMMKASGPGEAGAIARLGTNQR